jgi:hypothetical protein
MNGRVWVCMLAFFTDNPDAYEYQQEGVSTMSA